MGQVFRFALDVKSRELLASEGLILKMLALGHDKHRWPEI